MSLAHPFNPAKLLFWSGQIEGALQHLRTRAPINVEWDLSNVCPHDCPFCSFGTSESQGYRQQNWKNFPLDRALALIPEMAKAGVRAVTLTGGGEPLIHPNANQIMEALAGTLDFGLVTNGQLLDRSERILAEHATFVRVSLDAGKEETHTKLHRPKPAPQFSKILANMRSLIRRAEDVERYHLAPLMVGASFCVTDENWMEMGLAAMILRDMGASYMEVRPTYPTEWRGDGWGMALSNVTAAQAALDDVRRDMASEGFKIIGMLDRFEQLKRPDKKYARCNVGPLMSVIGADGRMWHCCVQRGQPDFEVANVIDMPFEEAWGKAMDRRMAEVIDVKGCPRCRYDNYNELLEGIQNETMHLPFV